MKPVRDPRYLAWIRTLPCAVCGSRRGIEASHTGPHGLGQKSSDLTAIPLCRKHHRGGNSSYHKLGPRRFAEIHNLNLVELVRKLNTRPAIRVVNGFFIGQLDHDEVFLGPVHDGVSRAAQKMIAFCRESRAGGVA